MMLACDALYVSREYLLPDAGQALHGRNSIPGEEVFHAITTPRDSSTRRWAAGGGGPGPGR
jgi:hypothetical protein